MTDRNDRQSDRSSRPSTLSHVIAGVIVGWAELRSLRRQREGRPDEKQTSGMQKLIEHHKQMQWTCWVLCLLGVWLLVSPATFSYGLQPVELPGGREVWLSAGTRAWVHAVNDILCGIALIVLGWRSLTPNRPISQWLACGVGGWLNFAPVLFWAPRAVIYLNETFVGVLVIALTILIPGMPNMPRFMKMGPNKPPGWTFNPSSWPQRAIMIALGLAGWLVSRHLGMYQLGYLDRPWEPFFGAGSVQVLTSRISESLPVSDGSLGALAYTFEFLMGWMGGQSRWRTMPWMVTFFGILVIPLGLVHISLVISQPVVVGHWCTLCLTAAAIMLPMIPLEVDEVVAMMQFTLGARKRGESLWRVFWMGGTVEGEDDHRTPEIFNTPKHP
ncbi:MAG: vitamin K epoxide reductase family protein, partial [Phycisphaerales bacterium]